MPRTDGLVRILFPSTAEVARAMTKDLSEIAGIKSHTNIDGTRVVTIRFKNGGELIRRYGGRRNATDIRSDQGDVRGLRGRHLRLSAM